MAGTAAKGSGQALREAAEIQTLNHESRGHLDKDKNNPPFDPFGSA